MKQIIALALIFAIASFSGATKISEELAIRLNVANTNEFIPIILYVKQKVEPDELYQFNGLDKTLRRQKCVAYLKEKNSAYAQPVVKIINENPGSFKNLVQLFITSIITLDATPSLIKILALAPETEWIDLRRKKPAIIDEITRPFYELELSWGIRHIQAPVVWNNYSIKGKGILIGIIDTGVDYHHPSLFGRVWKNPNEIQWNGLDDDYNGYVDDVYGWDFTERTPYAMDQKGHGTFVAGIACGDTTGGNIIGTAPEASFIPIKVLDSHGSGEENWAWEGIQYALLMGADVVNLSIGWRGSEPRSRARWRNIIDIATASGMVVVAGAGNEGDEVNAPYSIRTPGDVPSAITVGATTGSDAVADFSSVGPVTWADVPGYYDYPYPPGLLKPDLTAPGVNILSSTLGGTFQSGWNGTSMSAPFVSGTIALMLQAEPELDPDSVRTILITTAEDIFVRGPDTLSGYGRINALRAVKTAMGNSFGTLSCTILPPARTYITDGTREITIEETSAFSVELKAPGDYVAIFTAYAFVPETISFHIEPENTIIRNISLVPKRLINTKIEVRDFDTGLIVPTGYIEFMGSTYESTPEFPGVFSLSLPINDSVEITAGAKGFISTRTKFIAKSVRKSLFIHKALDFEHDSLFYTTSGRDWQWGTPTYSMGPSGCRSGERCWGTNLRGNYSDNANSWLVTPLFTVDSTDSPYVAFWHWYELEASSSGWWDGGNVWLSADESPFSIIVPNIGYSGVIDSYNTILGGLPAFSGEITGKIWHQVEFDLSRFEANSRFIFIFRLGSDNNTPRAGWYIDDFAFVARSRRPPFIFHEPLHDSLMPPIQFACRIIPIKKELDTTSVTLHILSETIDTTIPMFPIPGYSDSFFAEFFPPRTYGGEIIRYFISASDLGGYTSKAPPQAPDSCYSFYINWDITPPSVELLYMPQHSLSSASKYRVIVRIFDETGIDSTSIRIWYRLNGGSLFSSNEFRYSSVDSSYEIIIPNSDERTSSVEWYLECADKSMRHNYTRYPASGFLAFYPVDSIYWDFQTAPHGYTDGIWEWGEPIGLYPLIEPGERLWATSLSGNYPNNNTSKLFLDEVDLFGLTDVTYRFEHLCIFDTTTPYADGGDIFVKLEQGNEIKLHPVDGYDNTSANWNPTFSGDSIFGGFHHWRTVRGSLSEFVGNRVIFIFRFASDSTQNARGWFINNFSLSTQPTNIELSTIKPQKLELVGPFPNPANNAVKFSFLKEKPKKIEIKSYNILGKIVLSQKFFYPKGTNEIEIKLDNLSSGIYIFLISADNAVLTKNIAVLK